MSRGRHSEALQHFQLSVKLSPENLDARLAFFGATVALPENFTPTPDCVNASQENMIKLTEHPSGVLKAVKITPDFSEVRKMLQLSENKTRDVIKDADIKSTPFGFLPTQTQTSLYEAWLAATHDPKRGIRMCDGTDDSQIQQHIVAMEGKAIAVDLLSLFTLQGLGMLHLLALTNSVIYAHISLLDSVVEQLIMLRYHSGGGRMGTYEGQLFFTPSDPVEEARKIACLKEIRDFLKTSPVQLVGLKPGAIADERLKHIVPACGRACILPIFVANESKRPASRQLTSGT